MGFAFLVGHGLSGRSGGLRKTLLQHFSANAEEITTAGRQFPITARVDVQSALEELLQKRPGTKLLGIVSQNGHEAPQLAPLLAKGPFVMSEAGPVQHDEIDIGEPVPARCLKNGLWLSCENNLPFAILMAPGGRFGMNAGVQVEIAVPAGDGGVRLSQDLFRELEVIVGQGQRIVGASFHSRPTSIPWAAAVW